MKRAAVVTIYHVPNYGSVLQAFATQEIIEKMGWRCDIIRYRYPNAWHISQNPSLKKRLYSRIAELLELKLDPRKRRRIELFRNKYFHFTNEFKSLDDLKEADWTKYDVLVAGSDQLWNAKYTLGDSAFLLSFVPDSQRRISIASSSATKSIPDKYIGKFKKELEKFSAISVREENTKLMLTQQLGITLPIKIVLDPTLLMSSTEWLNCFVQKMGTNIGEKYILLYLLDYAFSGEDLKSYTYELLRYYSDKLGIKKIIAIEGYSTFKECGLRMEQAKDSTVQRFIQLFSNSSFVVTSSFHGTAFAINFSKPLVSIVPSKDKEDNRQSSLLKQLGIEGCVAKVNKSPEDIKPFYDSKKIQIALERKRKESLEWIKNAL